jgi:protein SCO1/2
MDAAIRRGIAALLALLATGLTQAADDPHAHHRQQRAPGYTRSVQDYRVPALTLTRDDGATVAATELFATDRPVVVSFIFTSCGAICPVLTSTLAQARKQLGADAGRVRIVSVSIDPEHDTPARLREYARQFQASGDWRFYTGSRSAVVAFQRAFDAYRGDKSNHTPLVLIRPPGQSRWVRLDGFTSAAELVSELHRPLDS